MTLHSFPYAPDVWWACHEPERPHEPGRTIYDENCSKCALALQAAVRNGDLTLDTEFADWDNQGRLREMTTVAECLRRYGLDTP